MPFLLVIAGPNGSGKTTLTRYLRATGIDLGIYINPDDIAADLEGSPEDVARRSQFIADERRSACMADRVDFSFETVMSHPSKVEFMGEAARAGYDVSLFFISTEEPRINISRVENRVLSGGHDVPVDRIEARYHRSHHLLPAAVLAAQRSVMFDNSLLVTTNSANGLRVVAEVLRRDSSLDIQTDPDLPRWINDTLIRPLYSLMGQAVEGRPLLVNVRTRLSSF